MKSFFLQIGKSIWSPDFYRELEGRSFSYSIAYFFKLVVLLSIALTLLHFSFGFLFDPGYRSFGSTADKTKTAIMDYYPDELVVTIKDGKASTNVKEPYFFKTPPSFISEDETEKTSENLLVIDTSREISPSLFEEYDTDMILTRDQMGFYSDGDLRAIPLKIDVTIDESYVARLVNIFTPLIKFFVYLMPLWLFIFMAFVLSINLVYFLAFALLVWLIMRIKKIGGTYEKAYQIAIHAFTFSLILETVLRYTYRFTNVGPVDIPFLFTIISLVIVWINLKRPESLSESI